MRTPNFSNRFPNANLLFINTTFVYVGFKLKVIGISNQVIKLKGVNTGGEQFMSAEEYETGVNKSLITDIVYPQRLSELEEELLAIVRSMSNALINVREHIEFHEGNVSFIKTELTDMCKANEEYSCYLRNFEIMKQFNYK